MSAFAALRYKDFRYCSGIRFLFTCAYQMQATVLGFYIYQVTHSKTAIAWMGLSEALPAIGFALFGGHIVDRSGKRSMLLLVHVIALSTALVVGGAAWGHTVAPLLLYALFCCNGFARALYEPSIFAVHAGSIPREYFANAGSWGNISWQGATVIGPLLGSLLYVEGGLPATYVAILLLLGCSLVLVLRLGVYPPVQTEQERLWPSVRSGLRFVFHQKMVCYAMSLDLFSVLFGGVIALLPVYALDILKVGPEGLGMMRVAFSLGAALSMIVLVRVSPMGRPWRNLLVAVAGFGVAILGFGLSRSFALSLAFLFAQGAFDSVSVMIRGTLLQLLTPEAMRGRVSAVNTMFIGSSSEIGNVESGLTAQWMGTVPSVLFGGVMTLGIVIFTYCKTKNLWHARSSDEKNDPTV